MEVTRLFLAQATNRLATTTGPKMRKLHGLNSKLYARHFGTSHCMGHMWKSNVMQQDDAVSEFTQTFVLDHGMLLSNSVTVQVFIDCVTVK